MEAGLQPSTLQNVRSPGVPTPPEFLGNAKVRCQIALDFLQGGGVDTYSMIETRQETMVLPSESIMAEQSCKAAWEANREEAQGYRLLP